LRFSGRDLADCLAYAELFALAEGSFSLEPLVQEPRFVRGAPTHDLAAQLAPPS
jgi:hypothetical protein